MSKKKSRNPFSAKMIRKVFRKRGSIIGLGAVALSGVVAAVLSPRVRERARQLKSATAARLRGASKTAANGAANLAR